MLQEGDIVELKDGHKILATVPEHFLYANREWSMRPVKGLVTIGGELAYIAGRYVVYRTTKDGGDLGHGPNDVYPDGHHVFCERMDDQSVKVDFYQSGCFTAMLPDLRRVGKAVRRWVECAA